MSWKSCSRYAGNTDFDEPEYAFRPQTLGLSGTSESNWTLTDSIRPVTPTSLSVEPSECWSGCKDVASHNDSGNSNTTNAQDVGSPSMRKIGGRFIPSSIHGWWHSLAYKPEAAALLSRPFRVPIGNLSVRDHRVPAPSTRGLSMLEPDSGPTRASGS